jgi:hypothetical protein
MIAQLSHFLVESLLKRLDGYSSVSLVILSQRSSQQISIASHHGLSRGTPGVIMLDGSHSVVWVTVVTVELPMCPIVL